MSWSLRFAEPIVLEDGTELASLRDTSSTPPAAERGRPAVRRPMTNAAGMRPGRAARIAPYRRLTAALNAPQPAAAGTGPPQAKAGHGMKFTHRFATPD